MSFGQMPWQWIAENFLTRFTAEKGTIGKSVAALKCYLAITAYRDYLTEETVLSTADLMSICGLSKPMVLAGVAILEAENMVFIESRAERNTNVYRVPATGSSFRKVPQDVVYLSLRGIENRGAVNLDALKLYLALLYYRDEDDHSATVSHKSLVERTGIRSNRITGAYSVLHNVRLVVVDRMAAADKFGGHPMNVYRLKGDFEGRLGRIARPTEIIRLERRRRRRLEAVAPWAR